MQSGKKPMGYPNLFYLVPRNLPERCDGPGALEMRPKCLWVVANEVPLFGRKISKILDEHVSMWEQLARSLSPRKDDLRIPKEAMIRPTKARLTKYHRQCLILPEIYQRIPIMAEGEVCFASFSDWAFIQGDEFSMPWELLEEAARIVIPLENQVVSASAETSVERFEAVDQKICLHGIRSAQAECQLDQHPRYSSLLSNMKDWWKIARYCKILQNTSRFSFWKNASFQHAFWTFSQGISSESKPSGQDGASSHASSRWPSSLRKGATGATGATGAKLPWQSSLEVQDTPSYSGRSLLRKNIFSKVSF